jgi:DNA-binding beta-propeller fold protein YncE
MNVRSKLALGLLAITALSSVQASPPVYRVIARYQIGGHESGFDYLRLDAPTHRLFVAHATRVEVIDADSGRKLGEIADTPGVHGIAFAHEFGHGFTTNGLARSVTMFDLETLRMLAVIRYMGVKPDAIEYDPESRRVFVVNGGETGDVSVIAPDSGAILATVPLAGGKLEEIQFDGRGRGFVNDEARSALHVFDTHTLTPLATWSLLPCNAPTGLAFDRDRHRLFSACDNNKLVVLDSDTGRIVAVAAIGKDPDGAVFDPRSHRVLVSNHDGTLSVVEAGTGESYPTLQTVATEPGARTIALDERNGRVYLPFIKSGPETFGVLVVGQ